MDSAFLPLHHWLLLSTIYSAAVFFLVHVVAVHAIVYSLTLSESDCRAEGVKFELGISHRIVKLIFASGFAFAGPTPLFDSRSAGSRSCAGKSTLRYRLANRKRSSLYYAICPLALLAFVEKPHTFFHLIDIVLDQTHGCHILVLRTGIVSLPHRSNQAPVVLP